MKKHFKFKRGSIFLLAFILVACLALDAWAGSSNIYILKSVYDAATSIRLFAGPKVNQLGAGSNALLLATHYQDDGEMPWHSGTYHRLTIFSSPWNPAWLLFERSDGRYSIVRDELGPTRPTELTIDSLTYYLKGQPAAPQTLAVTPGYEVAKATWTLSADYDYESVDLELSAASDFSTRIDAIDDAGVHATTTNIAGKPLQYKTGQLIDGRLMGTGTNYWVRVKGKISGVSDSVWASQGFATLSGGGGAVTINLKRTVVSGLGINSFSAPNRTCTISSPLRGSTDRTSALTSTSITNAYDLCKAINEIQGVPVVRTFGFWNQDSQVEYGQVITYSGTDIDPTIVTALRAVTLEPGRGYQIFLKPEGADADLNITFTLQ